MKITRLLIALLLALDLGRVYAHSCTGTDTHAICQYVAHSNFNPLSATACAGASLPPYSGTVCPDYTPVCTGQSTTNTDCSGYGGTYGCTNYASHATHTLSASYTHSCVPHVNPCDALENTAASFTGTGGAPDTVCSGGCSAESEMVFEVPSGAWGGSFVYDGNECAGADTATQSGPPTTPVEDYVMDSVDPPQIKGPNDNYIHNVDEGNCEKGGNGAIVCNGVGNEVPPSPDNGTPYEPAEPTSEVELTFNGPGGGTFNITEFSSSASSVNWNTGITRTDPGTNLPVHGDGEGNYVPGECDPETEDCDGDTPGDCNPDIEDCDGDGSVTGGPIGDGGEWKGLEEPELEDMPSLADSAEEFLARVQAAPLLAPLATLGASFPSGGTCPVASFSMFNESFVIDAHCDLWDTYGALLTALLLFGYALLGVRIIFSA